MQNYKLLEIKKDCDKRKKYEWKIAFLVDENREVTLKKTVTLKICFLPVWETIKIF